MDGSWAADSLGSGSLVHVGWRREDRERLRCRQIPYEEPAQYPSALAVGPVAKPEVVEQMAPVWAVSAAVSFAWPAGAFPVPLVLAVVAPAAHLEAVERMGPVTVVSAAILFARAAAASPVPLALAPARAHGRRPASGR